MFPKEITKRKNRCLFDRRNKGRLKIAKILLFFLASYALMYGLGLVTPLGEWPVKDATLGKADYMIFLLPIAGFFLSYITINWMDSFFEKKIGNSPIYPATIIVLGISAYYISLWFWFGNVAALGGSGEFDFWKLFINSHYIYFLIAALLAWVSKKAMALLPE